MPRPELILRRSHELIFTAIEQPFHKRQDLFSKKIDSEECPIAFSENCASAIAFKDKIGLYQFQEEAFSETGAVSEANVLNTLLSPSGKFLIAQSAVTKENPANVGIWDLSSMKLLKRFQQHSWPVFSWGNDDNICLRITTNAVVVLEGDFSVETKPIGKIPLQLVKGKECVGEIRLNTIVIIQPSDKMESGSIQLFNKDDLSVASNVFPLSTLDGGEILWAPNHLNAIVITRVDTDRSNQSYYGTRGVILIDCVKRKMKSIKLSEGSSPHDITWSPNGKEFLIVHGRMPRNGATIYSSSGYPLFEFSTAPRNIVSWAPNGRTIALGGSGSLNGEFVFWDRENLDNSLKSNGRMGSFTMKCSTYSWSPCSRYFLCAVLSSRMQVGNCVTIWNIEGTQIMKIEIDRLLEARWIPYDLKLYENIPFKPKYQSAKSTEEKPMLFVPKHRSTEAATLLKRNSGNDGVRRVTANSNVIRKGSDGVLGATVLTEKKEKSLKDNSLKEFQKAQIDQAKKEEENQEASKKVRALSKKLREIVRLMDIPAKDLTEMQLEKLGKRGALEEEIQRLRGTFLEGS